MGRGRGQTGLALRKLWGLQGAVEVGRWEGTQTRPCTRWGHGAESSFDHSSRHAEAHRGLSARVPSTAPWTDIGKAGIVQIHEDPPGDQGDSSGQG